jgi:hypothetical protein
MSSPISEKEWLDLAWKHFLQHAQQRIQYFNYFVVFSTILTTGVVTTFQSNFQAQYLGIGLGAIQAFLSYMFWKIDERNRFLTKHSEDVIKELEKNCCEVDEYRLFTKEDQKTAKQRVDDKDKVRLWWQFSHGESYRLIYVTFFFIGIIGMFISGFGILTKKSTETQSSPYEAIFVNVDSAGKFKKQLLQMDSLNITSAVVLKRLLQKEDSLKELIKILSDEKARRRRKDSLQ